MTQAYDTIKRGNADCQLGKVKKKSMFKIFNFHVKLRNNCLRRVRTCSCVWILADREGKNKCLENVINKEALNIK